MKSNKFKTAPMARTASRVVTYLEENSLVFVGLMGAGKSTIGKRVAHILDLPFYDADVEIEKAAQMPVSELFANYGEPEFRDLERRVILRLLKQGPIVLATGGGAYMNSETRNAIAKNAISVWLNADIDTLMERVSRRQNRPLLQNDNPRGVMEELMNIRYPIYAEANLTINSRKVRRDIIARDVIKNVERYLSSKNTPNPQK